MEIWTEVRRRVLPREITKRAACKEYGLHWKTLRKILEHVEPPAIAGRSSVQSRGSARSCRGFTRCWNTPPALLFERH
jgi:hypothetical protein